MVAAHAVERAAHRVAEKPQLHGFGLDPCVDLARGIERLLAGAILHQLDAPEETAAADIADVRMRLEPTAQTRFEAARESAHAFDQSAFGESPLHGERRRACDRMADVGVPVLKEARALLDRIVN